MDNNLITYDEIGNPLTYYDGTTFTWEGRQMQSATIGNQVLQFQYNSDGYRTTKTVDGVKTVYILDGSKVIMEQTGTGTPIYYTYDAAGLPTTMTVGSTTYYYIYNLQGDIIAITNGGGMKVVEYTYDPWGKLISITGSSASTIGVQNPYRYRAYRYDTELEMYYLNSRYYDPEIGRFINADDIGLLGANGELISYNLYIYCGNNPIIYIDSLGTSWENINDFFEAFFDSIVLEVGVGYGLDRSYGAGSLGEVSLGAYHDALTIGIKDGKTYTAISGSAGASIEVFEEIELGISTEYEHTFEEGYNSVFDEHTTHSAPWDVYNCPKTIKDPFKFEIGLKETNISDDGFILGTSGSRHTLVGGHYVVGFDIVGFLKRLFS